MNLLSMVLRGSAICVLAAGCATATEEAVPEGGEASSDELAAASRSCGSKYTPAQQRYELAVLAAKAMIAKDVCGETTHPRNRSLVATNTVEDVESLMVESIATCDYFRQIYNTSVYAKPVRTILAASALRGIVDGSVNPTTMVGLSGRLEGATLYGPKPGVRHTHWVTFQAGNRAVFKHYDGEADRDVEFPHTYTVVTGAAPKIIFTSADPTVSPSSYNIRHVAGSSLFELVSDGGDVLSSFSDPCSA